MELCSMSGLKGKVTIPGDKSISHRCVMFGSLPTVQRKFTTFSPVRTVLLPSVVFQPLELRLKQISPSQK